MNRRPEELAERFFLGNAGSYDHIARLSTLGLDGWWKRKILKKIPKTANRILRKGGLLVMHELTRPTRPLFLVLWNIHFKFLQAYGNWKHPEWNMAFNDVPFLLTRTRWVGELTRALRANRFSDIEIENQIFGTSVIVSARK